jgi:hypothetical protein
MTKISAIALGVVLWTSVAAAQFVAPGGVIPVVANTPGQGGSFWRSDVSVLNLNDHDVSVVLMLQPEIRDGEPTFDPMVTDSITIPANEQLTMPNVVQTEFGLINEKGALSVLSLDGSPLTMSSRTYIFDDDGGSYGQDIHSAIAARVAWIPGIRQDGFFRTNIGIFLPLAPVPGASVVFTVTVYDADGTAAGTGTLSFPEAGVIQKNLDFFGVDTLIDGYVVLTCSDPSVAWYGYGSVVDWTTHDAVYHAARGRQGDLP